MDLHQDAFFEILAGVYFLDSGRCVLVADRIQLGKEQAFLQDPCGCYILGFWRPVCLWLLSP